jgi:pimeloyl-ACP methyl ester carboxylesterase
LPSPGVIRPGPRSPSAVAGSLDCVAGGPESIARVDVGGLSLAYRRAGSGLPLVLLHGAYEDSRVWRKQISGLSDEFTVVAPDVPGFGASDDPPRNWTAADYGCCLARFIDALALRRPVVLGLSMGSVLALALYEQRPDLPGSLVLASAYAGWAGSLPPQEVRRRLEQAARDLEAPPEQILMAGLPTVLTPAAPQDVVDLLAEMMRDIHRAGMRVALDALGPADLRHVLGRIEVPTLLLYGDADRRSPVSVGQDLRARIRGSNLVVIPGAPHLANLEQPQAFNQAVRVFARRAALP